MIDDRPSGAGGRHRTLRRAPVGPGPSGPDWLATALGFWSGEVLSTGTAWAGLCLIHHHQFWRALVNSARRRGRVNGLIHSFIRDGAWGWCGLACQTSTLTSGLFEASAADCSGSVGALSVSGVHRHCERLRTTTVNASQLQEACWRCFQHLPSAPSPQAQWKQG